MHLPSELSAALDRLTEGESRHQLATRAAKISENYRAGGSSVAIAARGDALAYALTRMPATFAAVMACLETLRTARPDFAPCTLCDIGAGPGTATWAAAEAFPSIESFLLADSNEPLRTLGIELVRKQERLKRAEYRGGNAQAVLNGTEPADLVIASYIVGEIDGTARDALAELIWQRTREVLVIVEPGTPDGYQRIIALREQLIAQGAYVLAPCPHERACPLIAPDWCHFTQRLPRSRDHMLLKGANVPFEDEKFSYLVLSRMPPAQRAARVLAEPMQTKAAITAKLCTADGLSMATVPRREKAAYALARRWKWGDGV